MARHGLSIKNVVQSLITFCKHILRDCSKRSPQDLFDDIFDHLCSQWIIIKFFKPETIKFNGFLGFLQFQIFISAVWQSLANTIKTKHEASRSVENFYEISQNEPRISRNRCATNHRGQDCLENPKLRAEKGIRKELQQKFQFARWNENVRLWNSIVIILFRTLISEPLICTEEKKDLMFLDARGIELTRRYQFSSTKFQPVDHSWKWSSTKSLLHWVAPSAFTSMRSFRKEKTTRRRTSGSWTNTISKALSTKPPNDAWNFTYW